MTIAVVQSRAFGLDIAGGNLAFLSNVLAGSTLVVACMARDGGNLFTPPAGWTGLTNNHGGAGVFDGGCTGLFWKDGGSGAGGFSSLGGFSDGAGKPSAYTLWEISGAQPAPTSSTSANGAGTSNHPALGPLAGSLAGAIAVAMLAIADFNATPFTPDAGYTELLDQRCGAASSQAPAGTSIYQIGNAATYTPGSTGSRTAVWCGEAAVFLALPGGAPFAGEPGGGVW